MSRTDYLALGILAVPILSIIRSSYRDAKRQADREFEDSPGGYDEPNRRKDWWDGN